MIGTKLAHYEITSHLGTGGMGEVYRARDSKLKRDVAIKILPDVFAGDPERLARFQREAEVLATLNHPNIAHVYGLEESEKTRCIVMELVEGDTLADRLKRGPLLEGEALHVARQIAEALESAHEKGVVHRDLKPANIKLTSEQKVKVLDFGLAKVREPEASVSSMSNSPTMMSAASMPGVILGTVAYMSPEQARGKTVDKRTDIWAFGCVLFEMLTGRPLFDGETVSDTVAKILEREPDWQALPPAVSLGIRNLLRRCLQKDPARRLHDIADVRIEIEDVLSGYDRSTSAGSPQTASRRLPILWLLTATVAAAILIGSFLISRNLEKSSAPGISGVKRFVINVPSGAVISDVVLSPDGEQLVYVLGSDRSQLGGGDRSQLYHRKLDQFDARPIAGTEGAAYPFFSPDGQWVGFFADGKIKKVTLSGGVPIVICDARGLALGASWTEDDAIIFSPDIAAGLMQVSAAGGEPKPLTTPSREKGEIGHFLPNALPGGKGIVFNVVSQDGLHIAVLPRNAGQWRRLVPGRKPRYVSTGHLLFTQADRLFAAPFDFERMDLAGAPVPVIDGLGNDVLLGQPLVQFSVSSNGSLAYVPNTIGKMKLVWVDRSGKATPVRDETAYEYIYPRLSPDGRRLAIGADDAQIWIYDLLRGTRSRLTYGGFNFVPVWSADGKQVAFASYVAGSVDILTRPADLSGQATTLLGGANRRYPASWSPDGSSLVFQEASPAKGGDIRLMNGNGRSLSDLASSPAEERSARLSPDGEWVAYSSNETGRFEVYVRPARRPGGAITVSTNGGGDPLWSPDGRELFYVEGKNLMAVAIRTKPDLEASAPRKLFSALFQSTYLAGTAYDIAPDGQRFIMVTYSEADRPMQINIVLNWFDELMRLVPSGAK